MTIYLVRILTASCAVLVLCGAVHAQPATREWLERMWDNQNTRSQIGPQIRDGGIAFLPTDRVRTELTRIDPSLVALLTRGFARHLTFAVCRFTCEGCGLSKSAVDSFNNHLSNRTTYEKELVGANPEDPLVGKRFYDGSREEDCTSSLQSPIVVFLKGNIHREGNVLVVTAHLKYKDQGFDPSALASKPFTYGRRDAPLSQTARDIAKWSLDTLKEQTR